MKLRSPKICPSSRAYFWLRRSMNTAQMAEITISAQNSSASLALSPTHPMPTFVQEQASAINAPAANMRSPLRNFFPSVCSLFALIAIEMPTSSRTCVMISRPITALSLLARAKNRKVKKCPTHRISAPPICRSLLPCSIGALSPLYSVSSMRPADRHALRRELLYLPRFTPFCATPCGMVCPLLSAPVCNGASPKIP